MQLRNVLARLAASSVLLGCGAPSSTHPGSSPGDATAARVAERELVAAEEAVFAAIHRRDRAALEALTTEDFILRVPGAADVDRAAFLASISSIPGEIVAVDGEHVAARSPGHGTGIVTGFQVARVRVDGQVVVDRQAFADVFVRRSGGWRMNFAFGIVPASANDAAPTDPKQPAAASD